MPDTGYEIRWAEGLPVVATPVEIDVSNADELRQLLLACVEQGHAVLVVDMSDTVFCDSMGLHQLVRAHKRATAAGGEVRLVIAGPAVLRLFAIVGIDQFFPIFTNLDEALGRPPAPAVRPTPAPVNCPVSFPGMTAGAAAPDPPGC